MDLELAGKRAIVTGAARGIGLACARGLAAEGVHVTLVGRDAEALDAAASTVDACATNGARTVVAPADTTDDGAVRAMVEQSVAVFGGVDVLVNAAAQPAGGAPAPPLAELTDGAVLSDIDTKVLGYLRCARAVAGHMSAQGWGRIVNISGYGARNTYSIAGTIRNAGVAALTANLADELGPSGVNVSVVHPGMTETERTSDMVADRMAASGHDEATVRTELAAGTSIGRLITAAEIADIVVFLASPRAVAVTGDSIGAGGGNRGAVHY